MSKSDITRVPATAAQVRMLWYTAKKAGMDSDVLHARCQTVTGKEHISELSKTEAARLIDALTGSKCSARRQEDNRPMNRASQGQINVILSLAKKLGWLEDGSKRRLYAFLRARWGVERLDWMPPDVAVKVTEALKAMLKYGRGERKTTATNEQRRDYDGRGHDDRHGDS